MLSPKPAKPQVLSLVDSSRLGRRRGAADTAAPDVLFLFFETVHQKNKKPCVAMETVSLALMYPVGGSSFLAAETPKAWYLCKLLSAGCALQQRVHLGWQAGLSRGSQGN